MGARDPPVTTRIVEPRLSAGELGRFLEIQNLGLNLPFALAFLLLAAHGAPPLVPTVLLVIAFVAARNAGHSFNRWADRDLDARNPRTQGRALVTGRISPSLALGICALSGGVLLLAAYLLNPVALALAPLALLLVLGYSLTKRRTYLTTLFLGLVESVTPAAVYIGLMGTLPLPVYFAVGGLFAWGTAFETIHSLGDLGTDRALGLPSLPQRLGVRASVALVPALHAGALALLALYGWMERLPLPYFLGLAAMAVLALLVDRSVARTPDRVLGAFRAHFVLGALFLAGAALSVT